MSTAPLTTEELDALRAMNSPTIANAIETFNYRPRNEGFMDSTVRCILPELGAKVGYAATCVIEAFAPGTGNRRIHNADYWDHVASIPAPRIVVVQDVDQPPALGSMWGEVQANIHTALGCVGCVTNGGVRDLDEVRAGRLRLLGRRADRLARLHPSDRLRHASSRRRPRRQPRRSAPR